MQFDARAAKALQPGSHIVVDGCPGLRLLATQTGKTWTYRYKSAATGQMKQVRLGSWPEMAPVAAAARWAELRGVRMDGGDPRQVTRRAPAVVPKVYTLRDMVVDYADGYLDRQREAKGARAVRLRLQRVTAGHEGVPAAEVTRGFVFDVLDGLADRPMLAKSAKAELAAAWVFAVERGRISEDLPNWWAARSSRKLRSKGAMRDGVRKGTTKRVLFDDEIRRLVRDNLQLFSQQVQDFLLLQLWTLTRGVEICAMERSMLKREGGVLWWTYAKEFTKNRHVASATDLRVPLVGRAEQIAMRLLAGEGPYLFPSVSRQGVLQGQTQAYMQSKVHYRQPYSKTKPEHARERLTVTHWSPHDLRRTGRTRLAAMGVPHEIGEALLGHVLPGVAGDYNLYAYDKERVEWLTAWDAKLEQIISGA